MTGSAPAQLRPLRSTDAPAVLAAFHAGTVGMADPGEVTDEASKKVVDEIANVKTGRMDRPVEDVVIESVEIA